MSLKKYIWSLTSDAARKTIWPSKKWILAIISLFNYELSDRNETFFLIKDENRIFKRPLVKNHLCFLMKNKTDSLVSLLYYSSTSVLLYFGRPNICPINPQNINKRYRITWCNMYTAKAVRRGKWVTEILRLGLYIHSHTEIKSCYILGITTENHFKWHGLMNIDKKFFWRLTFRGGTEKWNALLFTPEEFSFRILV